MIFNPNIKFCFAKWWASCPLRNPYCLWFKICCNLPVLFFFLLHKQLTQMFSGMLRECVEFVSRREEVSWFCRLFRLWLLITFRLRVQRKLWENTLSELLTWVTPEHKPDKKEGWPEFTSNELILVGIYLKSGAHNQIVISAIVWATKAFLNIAKY